MPRRIPDEQRKRVIDLHRKGVNTEQIALKLRISEGSVSNIIHQERVVVPDYDELRELGLSLRDVGITLDEAKDGADLRKRINDLGISFEMISDAVDFYKRQSQRPDALIALGKRLNNLARQYGMTAEEIIATTETLGKQLEPLNRNIVDSRDEIRELHVQITDLKSLKALQDKLKHDNLTIEGMDGFIAQNRRLLELGFIPDIALLFATELVKYGLGPKAAAKILASNISDAKSLQQTINDQRKGLRELGDEIFSRTGRIDGLKDEINRLLKQKATKEKEIRDAKSEFDIESETMKNQLENLNKKIKEAEGNLNKTIAETDEMKSVQNTITSNLEKIKRTIEENEYLRIAITLMSESDIVLEWKAVEKASLPFLNGFIKQLQMNKQELYYSTLVSSAMTIRKILAEGARIDF